VIRAIAFASVMLCVSSAFADPVILVSSSDLVFGVALRDTLASRSVRVIAIGESAANTDGLASRSRTLASRERADVVVWLIPHPVAATLAAYDRARDQLIVRTLSHGSPLDAAGAAEAASTTRTMLRALESAPIPAPTPTAVETAPPPVHRPMRAREQTISATASFGVRANGDLEFGGAAVWRPDRLGLAVMANVSRLDLPSGMVTGRMADDSIALVARLPVRVAPRVRIAAHAGMALHVTDLDGTFETGAMVSDTRVDPAVRIGAGANYALGSRFELGFGVGTDTMLQRARYVVRAGDEIAVVPRVQLSGLMTLTVVVR
jgi:hypothetical protein